MWKWPYKFSATSSKTTGAIGCPSSSINLTHESLVQQNKFPIKLGWASFLKLINHYERATSLLWRYDDMHCALHGIRWSRPSFMHSLFGRKLQDFTHIEKEIRFGLREHISTCFIQPINYCLKRFGPFKVIEVLSLVTYHLSLPSTWKLYNTFYASLLHPYHKTQEYGVSPLPPIPKLIKGEPKCEVEGSYSSFKMAWTFKKAAVSG